MERRHVPSCDDKDRLPLLTSTQLVFFDKLHAKQVSGPPTKSRVNCYNILFPRGEEGKVGVERGFSYTNNQLKKATLKYEHEGQFFIRVAKVESKEDGTIKGIRCPVFNYTGNKIVRVDVYKK